MIPGSSFKAAMRSRLESFLRAINPDFAANPATELSDEAWNNVQDLVIDYEWKLRDVTKEKWYFHAQVVNRLSLLQDVTKVIADADAKQRAEAGIRTWSTPPLKFVVH